MTMARRVGKSNPTNSLLINTFTRKRWIMINPVKYFDFELVVGNFDTARNGEYFRRAVPICGQRRRRGQWPT